MAVALFVGGLAFATSDDRPGETFAANGTAAPAGLEPPRETTDAVGRPHGSRLDDRSLRAEPSRTKAPDRGGWR